MSVLTYLEIVTPKVQAVCELHERANGVSFAEPDDSLGGARVATLIDGSRVGVRAPMRESEEPMCRYYYQVDDLEKATEAARQAGAHVALDDMSLGGHGRISIVLLGGIEHGLWQLPNDEGR